MNCTDKLETDYENGKGSGNIGRNKIENINMDIGYPDDFDSFPAEIVDASIIKQNVKIFTNSIVKYFVYQILCLTLT